MIDPVKEYVADRDEQIVRNRKDNKLRNAVQQFTPHLVRTNNVKLFTWMGVPIIQYPTDLMVLQELIYEVKPDLIIETGIAFGGGLVFYASVLASIGHGQVLGIDIDPREHNVENFEKGVPGSRIHHIKGSSTAPKTIRGVYELIERYNVKKTLVILDSLHTHEHVRSELKIYASLVSVGSYMIVMDTAIEFFGHLDRNQDRPWGKGNNPWTAVQEFIAHNNDFNIDRSVEQRALITSAPDGWLRRVK